MKNYYISFIISSVVHIGLFLLLFSTILFNSEKPYVMKTGVNKKIVHAVTVSQHQVEQEIQQLKNQQTEKKQIKLRQIKKLQRLEKQAERKRIEAQKNLISIKHQQQQAAKLAEKRLAQIRHQQVVERDRLARLRHQQAKAKLAYNIQRTKLAKLHEKKLKEEQEQERKRNALAKARKQKYINGIINQYMARIQDAIEANWITPPNTNPNLFVTFQIQLSPKTGAVKNVTILASSGNKALDQSGMLAVYKASPLPLPLNKPQIADQFSQFSLKMHPGTANS